MLSPLGSAALLLSNPGARAFLPEPTDQTLGAGLSKPISSWGKEQTERLLYSLLLRKRDKKALYFDFKDQCVCSAVSRVSLVSQHVYECVLLIGHT